MKRLLPIIGVLCLAVPAFCKPRTTVSIIGAGVVTGNGTVTAQPTDKGGYVVKVSSQISMTMPPHGLNKIYEDWDASTSGFVIFVNWSANKSGATMPSSVDVVVTGQLTIKGTATIVSPNVNIGGPNHLYGDAEGKGSLQGSGVAGAFSVDALIHSAGTITQSFPKNGGSYPFSHVYTVPLDRSGSGSKAVAMSVLDSTSDWGWTGGYAGTFSGSSIVSFNLRAYLKR